jgi:hypothetical protein
MDKEHQHHDSNGQEESAKRIQEKIKRERCHDDKE